MAPTGDSVGQIEATNFDMHARKYVLYFSDSAGNFVSPFWLLLALSSDTLLVLTR